METVDCVSQDTDVPCCHQENAHIKSCNLVHHGVAAAVSGNQIVTWIPAPDNNNNNNGSDNTSADVTATTTPQDASFSSPSSSSFSSSSMLVYASNAILNIVDSRVINIGNVTQSSNDETGLPSSSSAGSCTLLRQVQNTLRCTTLEQSPPSVSISPIVITCVVTAKHNIPYSSATQRTALVSGFSNGMIQVWLYHDLENCWTEHTIIAPNTIEPSPSSNNCNGDNDLLRSITAIDAIWFTSYNDDTSNSDTTLHITAGTSAGMTWYECLFHYPSTTTTTHPNNISSRNLDVKTIITRGTTKPCGAVASLHYTCISLSQQQEEQTKQNDQNVPQDSAVLLLFIGTAAPRHNKIHVYQFHYDHQSTLTQSDSASLQYCGFLMGHEDWVTTLSSWKNNNFRSLDFLLASGSQDARIRIWKFRTTLSIETTSCTPSTSISENDDCHLERNKDDDDDDDNNIADDEFYDDVGESRLEIVHQSTHIQQDQSHPTIATTSVTLEALLCGHEEGITSVVWHPNPKLLYGIDQILISSSTDRTILLWSETPADVTTTTSNYGGIWTPLTRVGSAGGILGGSIGSTLLGFCGIAVEPTHGRTIVGHAYGGALHIWDVATSDQSVDKDIQWKASPCITGHFAGITDCCWEAANGDYLLTVSNDQTCRLWAQLKPELIIEKQNKQSAWFELARPQVHGYNLSAVASLSTHSHPHLIVTGADEKEIRAFDAPKTTLRLLDTLTDVRPIPNLNGIPTERVERAYIPSLGLSNKASPADAAAEDDETDIESKVTSSTQTMVRLPLERDLGAVSLWPEVQKLFGHNTEVYCLAAMSLPHSDNASENWTIVASSAKARDADDAKIRLWNVRSGQCIQVLSDGHKSTVATIDFSPSGEYLASSGKDRRLCLWKKQDSTSSSMPNYTLAWAMDAAHRRIVWSVHFCPYELHMLASASRDGCIKVWSIQEDPPELESKTKVTEIVNFCPSFQRGGKPDAVTAISFAPIPLINQAVLAIGLESGRIELWCISYEKGAALKVTSTPYMLSGLDPSLCHCDTVTKLAWRPIRSNTTSDATEKAGDITDDPILYLASCSMDHGCRIFEIEFQQAK